MRPLFCLLSLVSALTAGCALSANPLVLDPVGPARPPATEADTGQLLVFSAYSVHSPSPTNPDAPELHTDYEILGPMGSRRLIRNRAGAWDSDPAPVTLAPGNYRVQARANGYGLVTIPVVIARDETTVVHLEGGNAWSPTAGLAGPRAVRLPDGRIVGWRAEPLP